VAASLKKAGVQEMLETMARASGGEVAKNRVKVLREFIGSAVSGSRTDTMAFLSIAFLARARASLAALNASL